MPRVCSLADAWGEADAHLDRLQPHTSPPIVAPAPKQPVAPRAVATPSVATTISAKAATWAGPSGHSICKLDHFSLCVGFGVGVCIALLVMVVLLQKRHEQERQMLLDILLTIRQTPQ